jgi:hypothetical protein
MYRYESGNFVSLYIAVSKMKTALTLSKSRSRVNRQIHIHREVDSTGCLM